MARVDDYINARKLARDSLADQSIDDISRRSGFDIISGNSLFVPFLDRRYHIVFPDMQFVDASDETAEIPIQEQVLILHYLLGGEAFDSPPDWVSYREIPGASFYFSAFAKRAVNPLKSVFGQNIPGLKHAAGVLNANPVEPGDAAFEFDVFPRVPLRLIVWEGDAEFPAEANILFRAGVEKILSPEDIAWMAGMLVYRLIALSKSFSTGM
ncbi:MAG: DUF3786 domain-containing protein [Desulfobacterales bacterium]